jgi:hypothetical protein
VATYPGTSTYPGPNTYPGLTEDPPTGSVPGTFVVTHRPSGGLTATHAGADAGKEVAHA